MKPDEIKTARTALRVTQSGLADLVGVHAIKVSHWERGTTAPTSWQSVRMSTLASSPHASSIHAYYQCAGLAAALAVGLEHALTKGGAS